MENPNYRLKDKVVLVTGGASGIGKGIAETFIAEGAKVMIADINTDALSEIKPILGDACETIEVNVMVEGDLEKAVLKTVERFNRLDIGVNNAGTGTLATITDQTEEEWDRVINTCLKGVFLSMKHEARQMISQNSGGVIINIASLNARQPTEGFSAYCSAKAGVEMITKVGAMEMGPHNIRVCCISPGITDTPLVQFFFRDPELYDECLDNIPIGRCGTTQDIANAALYLASDEASWVTGHTFFVDGGGITKRFPEVYKRFSSTQ